MRQFLNLVLFCTCLSTGAFASTIYTASRSVGSGTLDLSITTNGTIGALTLADIEDWTITFNVNPKSQTLLGPLSGANSGLDLVDTALFATATALLFNFDAASGYALFQLSPVGGGGNFYCVQTAAGQCSGLMDASEMVFFSSNSQYQTESRTGEFVLASVAVPEPSSASLILLGLGVAGFYALRRRIAL